MLRESLDLRCRLVVVGSLCPPCASKCTNALPHNENNDLRVPSL